MAADRWLGTDGYRGDRGSLSGDRGSVIGGEAPSWRDPAQAGAALSREISEARRDNEWLRAEIEAARRDNAALRSHRPRASEVGSAGGGDSVSDRRSAAGDRRSVLSGATSGRHDAPRERYVPLSLQDRHDRRSAAGDGQARLTASNLALARAEGPSRRERTTLFDSDGRYIPVSLRQDRVSDHTPKQTWAAEPTRWERFVERHGDVLDPEVVRDQYRVHEERVRRLVERSPAVAERFDVAAGRFSSSEARQSMPREGDEGERWARSRPEEQPPRDGSWERRRDGGWDPRQQRGWDGGRDDARDGGWDRRRPDEPQQRDGGWDRRRPDEPPQQQRGGGWDEAPQPPPHDRRRPDDPRQRDGGWGRRPDEPPPQQQRGGGWDGARDEPPRDGGWDRRRPDEPPQQLQRGGGWDEAPQPPPHDRRRPDEPLQRDGGWDRRPDEPPQRDGGWDGRRARDEPPQQPPPPPDGGWDRREPPPQQSDPRGDARSDGQRPRAGGDAPSPRRFAGADVLLTRRPLGPAAGDSPYTEQDGEWGSGIRISGRARVGGRLGVRVCRDSWPAELRSANGEPSEQLLSRCRVTWLSGGPPGEGGRLRVVATDVPEYTATEDDLGYCISVELDTGGGRSVSGISAVTPFVVGVPWVEGASVSGVPAVGEDLEVGFRVMGCGDAGAGSHTVVWRSADGGELLRGTVPQSSLFRVGPEDVGVCLECEVTPLAGRSVLGTPAVVTVGTVTQPREPTVERLSLRCPADRPLCAGCIVRAEVDATPADGLGEPEVVWSVGNRVAQKGGTTYRVEARDVGQRIECEYVAVTACGLRSRPAVAGVSVPQRAEAEGAVRLPKLELRGKTAGSVVQAADADTTAEWDWFASADGVTWRPIQGCGPDCPTTPADAGLQLRCRAHSVDGTVSEGRVVLGYSTSLAFNVASALEPPKREGDSCKGFRVRSSSDGETLLVLLSNRYVKVRTADEGREVKKRWSSQCRVRAVGGGVSVVIDVAAEESFSVQCRSEADRDELIASFRCFHALGLPSLCAELFGEDAHQQWRSGRAGAGVARRLRLPTDAHSTWLMAAAHATLGDQPPVADAEVPALVAEWSQHGIAWLEARLAISSLVARLTADSG